MDLLSLIGPVEWNDFENSYQKMQPLTRATAVRDRFHPLWSDWEFDAICRFIPLASLEDFRLIREGKALPAAAYRDRASMVRPEAVRQLWTGGVSLVLTSIDSYSDRVLALSRNLESALQCPVQVNLYATPGDAQGLGDHTDRHDVLVLQIRGEKTWDVYPSVATWNGQADHTDKPQKIVLQSGGWLYLPKGIRHEVRNNGSEPSVHLTVGFYPLTWGDIFQGSLDQARLIASPLKDRLPAGQTILETPEQVRRRLLALLPFVDLATQCDGYFKQFPCLAHPVPDLVPRETIEAANESTRFIWRKKTSSVRTEGGHLQLNRPYRRFPLDLCSELEPVVKKIVQADEFRVADLECEDSRDALPFCKLLANAGFLDIVRVR